MQLCRVPLNELAGGCCNNGSINAQVHTYGVIESDVTVTELGSQRESCNYRWTKSKVTTVQYTELHQNLM